MKEIKLTKGQVAFVDDEDFKLVSQWKWKYQKEGAARGVKNNGKIKTIYMHRLIMDVEEGGYIRHLNGNNLDNRKQNIKIVTKSAITHDRHRPHSSNYNGVYWNKGREKWLAQFKFNHEFHFLGYHLTEHSAALAYDKAAKKYFGKEAKLNFPTFFSRLLIKIKIYSNFLLSKFLTAMRPV